jgi:hypothetical protein
MKKSCEGSAVLSILEISTSLLAEASLLILLQAAIAATAKLKMIKRMVACLNFKYKKTIRCRLWRSINGK